MATPTQRSIRRLYRDLLVYARSDTKNLSELRREFRKPLNGDAVSVRVQRGQDRLSFLRITNVKPKQQQSGAGRWVYKDGKRLENVGGTLRDATGKVVSSYDGKNLDPEAVSRHRKGLKRAGFINNAHAKGIF